MPVDRLAEALEAHTTALHEHTAEIRKAEKRRRIREWVEATVLAAVFASLLMIVSAVMPGVPGLRIHERGTATTAKAVFDLQCTTLWANGYRLPACAKVNGTLTRVTGAP